MLDDSTHLLEQPVALRTAYADTGYLYLRGVLDRDAVTAVGEGLVEFLATRGILHGSLTEPRWTGRDPSAVGTHPPELHRMGLWEALMADPVTVALMTTVLGEAPFPVPIAQYQFKSPAAGADQRAGAHQDHFYNPGMHFRTFWVPLMTVDESLGGLALAAGCHTRGFLHDTTRPGNPLDSASIPTTAWRRADCRVGDVIVFHGATPHCGLPNRHGHFMRLSVDMRAQPLSAPTPVVGVVTDVDATALIVVDDSGRPTAIRFDSETIIRTTIANTVDVWDLKGHRVLAVVGDLGTATLIRTVL